MLLAHQLQEALLIAWQGKLIQRGVVILGFRCPMRMLRRAGGVLEPLGFRRYHRDGRLILMRLRSPTLYGAWGLGVVVKLLNTLRGISPNWLAHESFEAHTLLFIDIGATGFEGAEFLLWFVSVGSLPFDATHIQAILLIRHLILELDPMLLEIALMPAYSPGSSPLFTRVLL